MENDMGINEPELVNIVNQIEELEQKIFAHSLHKSGQTEQQFKWCQRKAEVNHEIQQLKSKMRESQIQRECKLYIDVEEYVESTSRPYLMDAIYCWSKLRSAALAVGEAMLEKKFEAGSESLRRGIMFANSLYL